MTSFQISRPNEEPPGYFKKKWNHLATFLEEYRQHIFYLFVFFVITCVLFLERFVCKFTLLYSFTINSIVLNYIDLMNTTESLLKAGPLSKTSKPKTLRIASSCGSYLRHWSYYIKLNRISKTYWYPFVNSVLSFRMI